MFTKLKESKWFKSLSEAFCGGRKCCDKEEVAADPKGTEKTEEAKDKAAHSAA